MPIITSIPYDPKTDIDEPGNLPNVSFISRKPQPLGTKFKVVCDSRTGIMIYVEIQRGKDGMSDAKYNKTMMKTAACTARLIEGTRTEEEALEQTRDERSDEIERTKDTYYADAWFGSVDAVLAAMERQAHLVAVIKTNSNRFPKKFIEEKMKNWPPGSHLLLESNIEFKKVFALGYKYSKRKVLVFIFNKGASHTEPGAPYEAIWRNNDNSYTNSHVPRPQCCSDYFKISNKVDRHNHIRQSELALEKVWITQCVFFRILTTIIGINMTDAWLTYRWHMPASHEHKNVTIEDFTRMTVHDILNLNHLPRHDPNRRALTLPLRRRRPDEDTETDEDLVSIENVTHPDMVLVDETETPMEGERLTQDSVLESSTNGEDEQEAMQADSEEENEIDDSDDNSDDNSDDDSDDIDEAIPLTQRRPHELVRTDEMDSEVRYTYHERSKRVKEKTITYRLRRRKCWFCKRKNTSYYCMECKPPEKASCLWVCRDCNSCERKHMRYAEECRECNEN